MAATTEGKAFANIMESLHRDHMMGRGRVKGLSFKVNLGHGINRMVYGGPRHTYNRPFTYREHRKHVWEIRRKRWKFRLLRPLREAKRRLSHAWQALQGRDCADDWY